MAKENRLNSELIKEPFEPVEKQRLYGVDVPHGEKARTSVSVWPTLDIKTIGDPNIRSGADTRKLASISRRNKDVAMALDLVMSAIFWVKGELRSRVTDEEKSIYGDLDSIIMDEIGSDLRNLGYQSFEKAQYSIVSAARQCGYCVSELVWQTKNGRWELAAIKNKPSWDFEPWKDDYDNLVYLYHTKTGDYFNPENFVFAPYLANEYGNWLGKSVLEPIYDDVILLEELERALRSNAKNSSIRLLWHSYTQERKKEEWQKVNADIDAAFEGKNSGVIHAPADTQDDKGWMPDDRIELIESKYVADAMEQLWEIIQELRKEIKRAIGVPDDLGSTSVPNGSWAKAQTTLNILIMKAQEAQEWLRDVINDQVIRRWLEYNYPNLPTDYKPPVWGYPETEEEVSLAKVEIIERAAAIGLVNLENTDAAEWASEYLKLPVFS